MVAENDVDVDETADVDVDVQKDGDHDEDDADVHVQASHRSRNAALHLIFGTRRCTELIFCSGPESGSGLEPDQPGFLKCRNGDRDVPKKSSGNIFKCPRRRKKTFWRTRI